VGGCVLELLQVARVLARADLDEAGGRGAAHVGARVARQVRQEVGRLLLQVRREARGVVGQRAHHDRADQLLRLHAVRDLRLEEGKD